MLEQRNANVSPENGMSHSSSTAVVIFSVGISFVSSFRNSVCTAMLEKLVNSIFVTERGKPKLRLQSHA